MARERIVITESFVQINVLGYLAKAGWSTSPHTTNLREHGVDIKVRNDKVSRYWLIEVKGDPSLKAKNPSGSRSSSLNSAIGQIITRMHTTGKRGYKYKYKYGIAFPISFKTMVLKKVPFDVLDKLNLYVFFVDHKGTTEEFSWRILKKTIPKMNDLSPPPFHTRFSTKGHH